jgi:hypothetical protein
LGAVLVQTELPVYSSSSCPTWPIGYLGDPLRQGDGLDNLNHAVVFLLSSTALSQRFLNGFSGAKFTMVKLIHFLVHASFCSVRCIEIFKILSGQAFFFCKKKFGITQLDPLSKNKVVFEKPQKQI